MDYQYDWWCSEVIIINTKSSKSSFDVWYRLFFIVFFHFKKCVWQYQVIYIIHFRICGELWINVEKDLCVNARDDLL